MEKMRQKTSNSYFCCATQKENEIQLLDVADLKDVPCPFQYIANALTEFCLKSNFQTDELFFYEIVEYKDPKKQPDNQLEVERGIGCLVKNKKATFLKRVTVISDIDGRTNKPVKFTENKKLFIQTYVPQDYRDLFSTPNTVLATEVAGCPSIVELQDSTLLGRLNGTIQSIDQQELWSILLENTRKPIEGMIRYNKRDKCFEGYNGKKWRSLLWGEK